jgi:hypothetical protein
MRWNAAPRVCVLGMEPSQLMTQVSASAVQGSAGAHTRIVGSICTNFSASSWQALSAIRPALGMMVSSCPTKLRRIA